MPEKFAIMLGSGFVDFIADAPGQTVTTVYGAPSAPLYQRDLGNSCVFVLSRHGDEHTIPPHAINYRANLAALSAEGVSAIVGLNTVGVISSIRDGGQIAVPDQLIDYTWGREHTFYNGDDSGVRHVDFTEPFSAELREQLLAAAKTAGIDCYDGGVYAATQGPRLETAAEIDRLDRDGADFVGMTGMPESILAAELGIRYALVVLVVNKAAGRGVKPIHEDVEANSHAAKALAIRLVEAFFANEISE